MEEKQGFVIVRVYALILNEKQEVLLADEYQLNMRMTKFPGGGLKYGEGTADCLRREALEELGQEVELLEHFYTTDYFQEALFYRGYQLISIYYLARLPEAPRFKISRIPFDFPEDTNGNMSFRWVSPLTLKEPDLSFPVDRKVLVMLRKYLLQQTGGGLSTEK